MADVTTNYSFPYPELGDSPDGATQVQALAEAVDTALDGVDDRVDTAETDIDSLDSRLDTLEGQAAYLITQSVITSDSSTFDGSAETQLASISATLVNGVRYELRVIANVGSSVAADAHILRIREDNSAGTQLAGPQIYCPTTSSVGYGFSFATQYTASSSASKTFVLTGRRNSGTGNGSIKAASDRRTYFQLWRAP